MIKYIWILLVTASAKPCPASTFYLIGSYRPQCHPDGTWVAKQCWGSTGTCWCVDAEGKKLTEPSTVDIDCAIGAIDARKNGKYRKGS